MKNEERRPNRRFAGPSISLGQIQLRFALIGRGNVCFDEELAAGESSALKETGLGPLGPGDGNPYVALLLGKRAPAFGDRGENPADRALRRAAGVVRDKRRIGVLAIPVALPDYIPAFARLRDIINLHNC